jgi:hypothetical protein
MEAACYFLFPNMKGFLPVCLAVVAAVNTGVAKPEPVVFSFRLPHQATFRVEEEAALGNAPWMRASLGDGTTDVVEFGSRVVLP